MTQRILTLLKLEVEPDLKKDIKLLAAARGVTMTDLVQRLMREELERSPDMVQMKQIQERLQTTQGSNGMSQTSHSFKE